MSTWDSFDTLFNQGADMDAPKQRDAKRQRTAEDDFSLRALPHDVREEVIPDVLEPTDSKELVVAETKFFNQRNRNYWQRSDLSHLRPFDFPYVRKLMESEADEILAPEDVRRTTNASKVIEVVPREYETQFLREPTGKERKCANMSQCQGMLIPNTGVNAFILREFLLPSQLEHYKRTGKLPKKNQLCLMCKRNEIAKAFINIRADGKGCKKNIILQDFRNMVNTPGEYDAKDVIVSAENCFQGLLDPVVLHSRSAYRIKIVNGIRHYEQWKYKHFLVQAPETRRRKVSGQTVRRGGEKKQQQKAKKMN